MRKYEKALRYIDQGGFLGEDKVQVRASWGGPAVLHDVDWVIESG